MSTKLFRAVSRLSAEFRWCLTGTPVQNSLEDLASLVAFIQVTPLDSISNFRKYIMHPLIKGTRDGLENIRLLLDSICLRRTRKLLNLPDMTDDDRFVEFSSPERAMYNTTQAEIIKAIKQGDNQARKDKGYIGIFHLQLQLRRLCNHGTFQKSFLRVSDDDIQFDPEEALALLQSRGHAKCTYCNIEVTDLKVIEDKCNGYFTVCGHLLCTACLSHYEKNLHRVGEFGLRCSVCMKKVTKDFLAGEKTTLDEAENRPASFSYFEDNGVSSKVAALISDIKTSRSNGKRYALEYLRKYGEYTEIIIKVSFSHAGPSLWISLGNTWL
jgi:SWI/SNF-related matrix-associated actin-dependent regulator of chromatin subfamily A3